MRRAIALLAAALLALASAPALAQSCATFLAGPATWTGVVNTYYPGVGTASAGSTSIGVGASTGAATPIAAGDLLLVIQMQDASIDSGNSSSYGGSGGGQGQTTLNSSGLYEYAVAAGPVSLGSVPLAAPLSNTYRSAAANASSGQKSFQVVRVPQASSATISGTLTAPAWNGSSGGIVAVDAAGTLSWGGSTIDVNGLGFRGGGGQCSIGSGGTWSNTDYRTSSTGLTLGTGALGTVPNGAKGEGVAGTPIIVFTPATPFSNAAGAITGTGGTDGTSGGYPGGSFARGAPGNAGGGGTDGNPPANDQNTGGGGGGNYGVGGKGGFGWTPGTPPGFDAGGFGGMSMPSGATRLFFGGGGGSASTNNCTGTPGAGAASSGASGGGLVFVRAGATSGTATINARGTSANSTITNDASGGGGAGGSVLLFVNNGGAPVGASINIQGGNGGSNTGGGAPHGPGGGGSGGFAILSGTATVNAAGGANGTTATSATSTAEYGSTSSVGGFQIVSLTASQIPGTASNSACFPQLTVTKSTSTPFVAQGGNAAYTITVANASGKSAARSVAITDDLPAGFTFASTSSVALAGGATRPLATNPAVGADPASWGSFTIPGGGSVTLTFLATVAGGTPVATYQNPATVTYEDPTRGTAGQQVATPGGTYATGGGSVPGSNYVAASTTNEDVAVILAPAVAKSFAPAAVSVGGTSVLTVTLSNPGGTALTAAGLVDNYPAGVVNAASPSAATTCTGGTVAAAPGGTSFTLSGATIPAAGSCTVTVNVTITAPGPYTNTIPAGALTNAQNVSNAVAGSATLFSTLTVQKSFSPSAVAPGADSTLSIDINNPNNSAINLTSLTDSLPANLTATGGAVTVTGAGCGAPAAFAPASAGAGATSITFTAGTIPANTTCRLSFAVRSNVTGIYANTTTGAVANGSTGPVSNTANLGVGLVNIAKAFSPASILAGGTSAVTLTLTNPTGVTQTAGTFTDALANMSVSGNQSVAGCGTTNALANGQTALTFTNLTIPPAGCTLTFNVTSTTVGAQSNTTGGVATALLPAGPVSNTAVLNVLGRPSIAKSFFPATIQPGGTSTLTFTVTNPSPIALSGMAFTDPYPAAITNASPLAVGGTCTGVTTTAAAGGGTFNVTAGSIPANSSCTITVQVTASTVGSHANTASGVTTTQTPGAGTTAGASLVVATPPTITKAFGTSPIAQGGTSVITFTIGNPNTIALASLNFTDALVGMSAASGAIGGTCVGTANSPALAAGMTTLNLTVPTLAAGSSCTVQVTVTSTTSGSWANTASGVTSTQTPIAGSASNTASLVVLSPPQLQKNFIPGVIQAGGPTSIRFTVTNPNAATALTNVAFSDALSNMVLGATPAVVETCGGSVTPTGVTAGGTSFSLVLNTLAGGESCTITVSPVTSNAASPVAGHVNTTSTVGSTQTTVNPGAAASDNLIVYAPPTVTKAFSPAVVTTSATSVVTFTVTNPNALPLTDIRFTDDLPANLSNNAAQVFVGGARGTCSTMIPASKAAGVIDPITFNNINLAPGASCTVMMDVFSGTAGFYPNTVTNIVSDQTTTAVGGGTDTLTVGARMILTESFTPATFEVGGTTTLRWLINNNNAGNNQQNIDLTATLPAGLQAVGGAVSFVNVAGSCTFAGAAPVLGAGATTITLTNFITDMDIGDICAVDIAVTATTAGDKSVTVTAPAAGNPTSIDNATDTQSVVVYERPAIAKAFSPATIAAGGTTTLTFTLSNTHPTRTLTNAAFTDTLTGMSVSGAQGVGGSCVGTTPAALANGATSLSFTGITIPAAGNCTVSVVVTSTTPGVLPNTASGVATTQTPTAGANSGAVNLTVGGIDVTKAFSPASRPRGLPTTLTITLTSTQAVNWTGLGFTDTLPANLVVASPANAATTCGAGTVTAPAGTNVISLSGGTLASGAGPCTVTLDVVSAMAGTYNNAAANFSGLSPGMAYTGGAASVVYFANAELTKAFSPATIGPGGTTTLTITLSNPAGAQAVTGLAFSDSLPAGVTVAATTGSSTTCGVPFAPAAGASTLSLSGVALAAGASSCTAQVNVTASTVGTYTNNGGNISGLAGGLTAPTANASFSVVGTALTKVFSPAAVGPGAASTLTFTLSNGSGSPPQANLAFTDTFPANLVVAATPSVVNNCGGAFTAVAGAGAVSLTNGALAAAQASCTIQVDVSSTQPGSYANAAANIGGVPASMDTSGVNATLQVLAPPTAAKAFGAANVAAGAATPLTLTFTNANNTAVTGLAFTDTFPVAPGAMTLANTTTSNTCGGTLADDTGGALGAGDAGIRLTGGTVPANGSCVVTVNVTASVPGAYANTIPASTITSTNAGSVATATTASVTFLGAPTIAKAFASPVGVGRPATLTFTVTNPNPATALTGVAFADAFPVAPAAMVVAATPNAGTGGCGTPTFAPAAGAASIAFSAGTLAAGGSCTVTVDVTAPAAGTYNNTSGAVSATGPVAVTGGTSAASLVVVQPALAKAFVPAAIDAGGTSTLAFTLTNGAGNPAQSGIDFIDTLPAGVVVASTPAIASTCPSGTGAVTAVAGAGTITVTGASMDAAQASCTVSVNVTSATAGAYANTNAANISGAQRLDTSGVNATLTVSALPVLTKAFAAADVGLGQVTTLAFSIANTGANAVNRSGLSFTDTLPAGLVIANPPAVASANCGTPGFTAVDGTQPFTASSIAVSAGATCTITLSVRGATLGAKVNGAAQMSAIAGLINGVTDQTLAVVQPALAKAFVPAAIDAGGTSTLTFTLANGTGNPAQGGIAFTDTLPAGVVVASTPAIASTCPSGTGAVTAVAGAGTITVTGASMNAAQASCTVSVNVTSATAGNHLNDAANFSATQRVDPSAASATLAVAALPSLTKAFGSSSVGIGRTATLTFTADNTGVNATNRAGLSFTDTLPAGLVIANPSAPSASGCGTPSFTAADGAQPFTASSIAVAAGTICTITITVRGASLGAKVNNGASISAAGGLANNVTPQTITVVQASLGKAFSPASIDLAGVSTLTFTLTNGAGNPAQSGIAFTDNLPGNVRVATAPNVQTNCPSGGGFGAPSFSVTATAGSASIAVSGASLIGGAAGCQVSVDVTANAAGAYTNNAASISGAASVTNAVSTSTLTVNAVAPTVSKAFSPATIASGNTSTLTITLGNPNAVPITVASVTDTFPVTPGAGLARAASPNTLTTCAGGSVSSTAGSVTLSSATVPAGGSCTFQVDVLAATAGSFVNTIPVGAVTSNAGGNTVAANATLTVTPVANVGVTKLGPATAATGGLVSYSIAITNAGPDAAPGTTFSDVVPAQLSGVAASCTGAGGGAACGAVNVAGNAVTTTIPALPAGGSVSLTITATASGLGSVTNTATVTAPGGIVDPVAANDSSSATTAILAPDLTIAKTHAGSFTVGTNGSYSLVVTNQPGALATSAPVTVTDTLPSGLGFVSASGAGWACAFASGTVSCLHAGVLSPGMSAAPITLVVSVASIAVPSVTNFATVGGGGEPAATTGNNLASDTTLVAAAAVSAFAPNGAQTALPGTVVFYPHTFTAGAAGSVSFTISAAATPAIPGWTQIVYRDNDCNGVLNGGEGGSVLNAPVAVNPGDVVCIVVKDSIPATAPYNALNNITVTATLNGSQNFTRSDATTVGGSGGAGLTLAKSVRNVTQGGAAATSGTARPNDVLEYTITYTNTSGGAVSSIVVTDATPTFTVFQAAACGALPGNVAACTVTSQPAVNGGGSVVWTLSGSLLSGGTGTVSYTVRVAP